MRQLLILILISGSVSVLVAQESYSIYQNHMFKHFDSYAYTSGKRFHTAIQPYQRSETDSLVNFDSLYRIPVKHKAWDIVLNRNLIKVTKPGYALTLDPLMNFEFGKASGQTEKSWINTRGFIAGGRIGKKVSFSTSFYENQAIYNDFRDSLIREIGVVPGQGSPKSYKETGYDYAFADAWVAVTPSEYFSFQLGHGKNFIGDGYRSLLLSDNSFNYPYFKITTTVWNIKYWIMWAQFQDLTAHYEYGTPHDKKWGVFHFLDYAATSWLNLGLFETVIWQNADSTGTRGFDVNYLNPIVFFRPVEFSVGSPDNVVMGGNLRLTILKRHTLYGQVMIDEFNLEEMKHYENGFWSNKFGFQVGYKAYNLLNIKNLSVQTEYNWVRPYTYSHINNLKNYGHYNQPLAHPMGSNFGESVSFLRYNHKRLFFELRYAFSKHGSDTASLNYGNNIFIPYTSRVSDYGNTMGQASEVKLQYTTATVAWLVNPVTNLNLYLSYTNRKQTGEFKNETQNLITFGIRTSLQNFYFDF